MGGPVIQFLYPVPSPQTYDTASHMCPPAGNPVTYVSQGTNNSGDLIFYSPVSLSPNSAVFLLHSMAFSCLKAKPLIFTRNLISSYLPKDLASMNIFNLFLFIIFLSLATKLYEPLCFLFVFMCSILYFSFENFNCGIYLQKQFSKDTHVYTMYTNIKHLTLV